MTVKVGTNESHAAMKSLGGNISEFLQVIYGKKMAFFLCVSEFDSGETTPGTADYISNSDRESGAKWLRETAAMLDQADMFKDVQGGKQ